MSVAIAILGRYTEVCGLRRGLATRGSYDLVDVFVGRRRGRPRSVADVCHDCNGFGELWGLFVLRKFN